MVDGQVYTDSVAIMRFLADHHNALAPAPGSVDRLKMDSHIEFLNEEFDALFWIAAKNSFINPSDHRSTDIKPVLMWEFERSLKRFADRLGDGPYLMGDEFTIADIMAVHCLNWSRVAKFPAAEGAVKAYAKSVRARAAYQRVMDLVADAT